MMVEPNSDTPSGRAAAKAEPEYAELEAPPDVARKAVGSVAVIQDGEGRVLLVRQAYARSKWALPGGGSDPGESVVETAVREVREETGLDVVAERMTGVYHEPGHPAGDFLHFVFACRRLDPSALPRLQQEELTDWRFSPPHDLPRPISDLTVRRIRDALSGEGPRLPVTVRRSRLLA